MDPSWPIRPSPILPVGAHSFNPTELERSTGGAQHRWSFACRQTTVAPRPQGKGLRVEGPNSLAPS